MHPALAIPVSGLVACAGSGRLVVPGGQKVGRAKDERNIARRDVGGGSWLVVGAKKVVRMACGSRVPNEVGFMCGSCSDQSR